ncbi:glycoside hydrolase family 16 protein [Aeromicrobium ginsengisoli]|uniref:Glycoside hydrolase family 16 protein n=1 Tax=Aeromicrobium ginsengisoli TaxID=363867 RepID=A0A5M4FG96_9ACTN|nr:glycoside hydrolase family 16 protein [Aeromicrobium ginsengisoli]KAA1398156.1 glycoside hydrolase family 16 protein [Aeromicrobium ginsengisoli]
MAADAFVETFDGTRLDEGRWLPHYLPHWSSRAESAATYDLADSELRLSIPADQGLWCHDSHPTPLRVSGIQSGAFSGPAGSTIGQQPFLDGQQVREEEPAWWGWTPRYGRIEVRARMQLSETSMASVWMIGLEDSPERCGEICLFEVFGNAIAAGGSTADVGTGLHAFRDPSLVEEFSADSQPIDVAEPHAYAVEWRPTGVDFLLDGGVVRSSQQAPHYPMQMMIAVFDFPTDEVGAGADAPFLAVDEVRWQPLA